MICSQPMDLLHVLLEDKDTCMATRSAECDSSSDVESTEYLNGEFDARTIHLYSLHDDPSSSEEEQSDNENVYVCMLYINAC